MSNWYKPTAEWLRLVAKSMATWILFQMSAETPILHGTEPVSALTHTLLYCCALWVYNFFLGFGHLADRVVNLNTTIRLALFWRTWTWALASTLPRVAAWHMDRDYSYCRASKLTDLISQKYRKNEGLIRDFSKAHAPNCLELNFGLLDCHCWIAWIQYQDTPDFLTSNLSWRHL